MVSQQLVADARSVIPQGSTLEICTKPRDEYIAVRRKPLVMVISIHDALISQNSLHVWRVDPFWMTIGYKASPYLSARIKCALLSLKVLKVGMVKYYLERDPDSAQKMKEESMPY